MSSADQFAQAFEAKFDLESLASGFTEIEQFRAMMRAFGALRPTFYVEEFHGFKRQIYFNTGLPWLRRRARCELCDVLIVTYSTVGGFESRLTLFQAKLSRKSHSTNRKTRLIELQEFRGNYEQWRLLSSRPQLLATTVFSPPRDLLSSAIMPSVGTFGVFYKGNSGLVEMFYAAADCLRPLHTPKGPCGRIGQLSTLSGGPAQRVVASRLEATYRPSIAAFAKALFQLKIGTPIHEDRPGIATSRHEPLSSWVRGVIAAQLASMDGESVTARELLDRLGPADPLPAGSDVPSLVVIRSSHPVDDQMDARTDQFG